MRQLVISQSITQREYKSIDRYFNEVEKIGMISAEEEVMLARRVHEGDYGALERLTTAHLRFVISVAKQYQNQGLTLGDLINEGNIGLIKAAKRYDESRGFRFISYAVWWIRQSIISAIADQSRMIRLPHNYLALLKKLYKAFAKIEQDNGRKPCVEEIAAYLDLPIEKAAELMSRNANSVSIDEPFRQDEESTLLDVLPCNEMAADQRILQESMEKEIRSSLKILSKRDRELLILYFGLDKFSPLSLEEIGDLFKISKEHAGRLKEKALSKLRSSSNAKVLMSCIS